MKSGKFLKHKDYIGKFVVFAIVGIALIPFYIVTILKYKLGGASIVILISFLLSPIIFFRSKSYWNKKTTNIIWLLRMLLIVNFLLYSYKSGEIMTIDIVSAIGWVSLSFFYEFGYFISMKGYINQFLISWILFNTLIAFYIFPIILSLFIKQGFWGIIVNVSKIRIYHPAWPNQLGIYFVLAIWAAVYFYLEHKKNRRLFFLLASFLFAFMFFTLSRTVVFMIIGSTFFAILFGKKIHFRKSTSILIFIALIFTGFIMFEAKEVYPGAAREYSFYSRLFRFKQMFLIWEGSPIIGYGFRSYTTILSEFIESGKLFLYTGTSHNDYFDLLVRGGALYSVVFWGFIIWIVRQGVKFADSKKPVIAYISYSIVALLISAFFQNPFKDSTTLFYFWSCVGMLGYYER